MVGALVLGACTSNGGGGVSPTTTATQPAGSQTPTVLPTVEPTGGPAWTTGPLTVTHDYPRAARNLAGRDPFGGAPRGRL
jgi:hypothetical protein